MTEVLWPPDLIPASQTWSILGNAATFTSPLSGATRTYGRPGARMGCTMTFPPMKGQDRARMMAFIQKVKDRGNRVWVRDFSTTQRGSFPSSELLTNNDFSNGTTGWTPDRCTLSVTDRVLRLTNTKSGGANFTVARSATVTQYAPLILRSMIDQVSRSGMSNGTFVQVANYAADRKGLVTQATIPTSGTLSSVHIGVFDTNGNVSVAGDYADISWSSLSRCMMADSGGNLLVRSDEFDNASWTKVGTTVTANAFTAPDGTTTGDKIVEDSSTGQHRLQQQATRTAAESDWCFAVAARRGDASNLRDRVRLLIFDSGTTNFGAVTFDLTAGTIAVAASVGGSATLARAFIWDMGGGWYYCSLITRLPASDTTVRGVCNLIENPTSQTYTGDGTSNIGLWRATLVQSSVPVRLVQSAGSSVAASAQSGSGIYVKGLPTSTQGLLEAGDPVQIGGQINFLTARLDSDAAGRGYLQCGRPWLAASNDAPVIVHQPMCKMILATDTIDLDTGPGQFSPFQIELVEAIE